MSDITIVIEQAYEPITVEILPYAPEGESIIVDDTFIDDSPNPVQSKVIQHGLINKAAIEHNHEIDDVNGLVGELGGKAAAAHGHVIGDVTGLQGALDGKQPFPLTTGTTISTDVNLSASEVYKKNIFDSAVNRTITIPDDIIPPGGWAYFEIVNDGVPEFVVSVGTINDHDLTDRLLVFVYRSESNKYVVI
jgi:hypothetical protein